MEQGNKRRRNAMCWNKLSFHCVLFIQAIVFSLTSNAQSNCVGIIDSTRNEFCVASGSITFSNAIASGQNVQWLSSGDGSFNNPSSQNPTYTPGPNDIATGYVFIYLDVYKDDPDPCSALPVATLLLGNMNAIATPASQTICSGAAMTRILFSGTLSGTVFNWTRDNTTAVTGLAASGSSLTDIRGALTNTTSAPVTVTFTITPTSSTCSGTPITATVLVNPKPVAVASQSTQTICSDARITPIALSSTTTGTTFTWTRNNTSSVTGIAASGTGDITGTLTNTSGSPVTVTFTITPTANGCTGNAITSTVIVNPTTNVVTTTPASQTICSGSAITSIIPGGGISGTTYTWTRNNTASVTGIANSGTGNISGSLTNTTAAPVYVTFTITASSSGCTNRATVLVNPIPAASATPASQTVCSGATITPILLSSVVNGATYSWTRNNTASVTGITASGTGNITGALTNTTSSPVTVTFTITPTANGCTGTAITATITINPSPGTASAAPSSQTICSGSAITAIALSGGINGSAYNWTRDNAATVTGISSSGSGNISGSLINTTNAPVTVTFTITPTANGCNGTPTTAAVIVNPRPTSVISGSQSICSGTPMSGISISLTGAAPWNFTYTNGTTPVTVTGNNSNPYTFIPPAAAATFTVTSLSDARCTSQASDRTGSAIISQLTYAVTASAGTNGSITPNGITNVNCGTSQTYNITPNSGFNIQDVLVDGISQGAIATYTFNNVTTTHTISATFSGGSFTISASAGSNGTITPSGSIGVATGSNQTFSITANSCYQIANVLVDGISQGAITSYTFNNITASHTISASFSPLSYTITASAGLNGTISPNGATSINCGASQAYTITANPGYIIQNVLVDGVAQGALTSYTFSNVTISHTISASFASAPLTITASAGANGVISPSGSVVVANGASQTFSIAPNSCYQIADVLVDGVSHGQVTSYTFNNVTVPHTISASFSSLSYIINASAGANGSITPNGASSVACGANQTYNITANAGFVIENVLVDGVSQGAISTYTFSNVTAAHNISVSFIAAPLTITASAGANGIISPSGSVIVANGASQTFNITANSCYQIADVLVDGISQGPVASYTFTTVTAAHTISASFSALSYTITAAAGNDGSISPNGATSVNCGGSQTYTITPNPGFAIQNVLVDGVSQGAIATYTFSNVTVPHTISATFTTGSYTINASAGANGSITPVGATVVAGGSSQTFTITPNDCYQVSNVLVDGISVGAVTTYTFSNVTAPHTISVSFSAISYAITASAGSRGSITPTGVTNVACGGSQTYAIKASGSARILNVIVDGVYQGAISSYTFSNVTAPHTISATFTTSTVYRITASAGTNGTITPAGSVGVISAANQTFTIAPNNCYQVANVLVDGVSVGAVTTYTFSNVRAAHTISASFSIRSYIITASAGAGGSVSPGGSTRVNCGGSQIYNITPDPGFAVQDVLIDGVSQGAITSYTFSNVTATHSISATFSSTGPSFTITASAGANGSISPSGSVSVAGGGSQTFAITPNSCYQVADVLVDGISVGAVTSYTFSNVTAPHSISASFSQLTFSISASAGTNGSISPNGATIVNCGASQTYNISANSGFTVQNVIVDGISQGAITSYTFSNVTAAHSISASFIAASITISASAGANGTISPSGSVGITSGSSQTFNMAANSCYQIADVLVDGVSQGPVTSYTFNNVTVPHTITVTFSALSYSINASAGANGSISPNGATSVNCGASQTYNIAANSCYQVANVLVDGVSQGPITTYTFTNVTAPHSISATFTQLTYGITASAGSNGSITPNGTTNVNCGTNQTYNIAANAGFAVQTVLVDGISQGAITSYTFNNVTAAHTISASFVTSAGCTAPTLSASVNNILCRNANTGSINLTTTGGTAPFSFAWTGPNGFTANTEDISSLAAGSYTVIVTATGGCSSSTTVTITQPAAALTATASAAAMACNGTTTTLTVTASGGTGTRQYSLNGGAYQTGTTFTVDAAGSPYIVTVRDANLCTINTNSVIVAPAPTGVPATPTGIDGPAYGLCGGGIFTYTVQPVAGATSYFWSGPASFTVVSGQNTATVQFSVPSNFTGSTGIWATARNACGSGTGFRLAVSATLSYPGSTISGPSTVSPSQTNVQYSLPFVSGATYNWLVPTGGAVTAGQGTNAVTVSFGTSSGNVSADITNACGTGPRVSKAVTVAAAKTAATTTQTLTVKTTATAAATNEYFSVYPNPAQSRATAIFSSPKKGIKFEVVVTNAVGETILTKSGMSIAGKNMLQFELGKFANGMYLVRLITQDRIQTQKLFKQ